MVNQLVKHIIRDLNKAFSSGDLTTNELQSIEHNARGYIEQTYHALRYELDSIEDNATVVLFEGLTSGYLSLNNYDCKQVEHEAATLLGIIMVRKGWIK